MPHTSGTSKSGKGLKLLMGLLLTAVIAVASVAIAKRIPGVRDLLREPGVE